MRISLATDSAEATRALGAQLAGLLPAGTVVLLVGGLGAGKTALAQGVARGLGVEGRVTSPTFTMVASHPTDGRRGIERLRHADLYRVGSGVEADDLAIAELVEDAAVAVVEWGDVAPDVLGARRVLLAIERGEGEDERLFELDDPEGLLDAEGLVEALAPWSAP